MKLDAKGARSYELVPNPSSRSMASFLSGVSIPPWNSNSPRRGSKSRPRHDQG